jgi:hypothetical protein
MAVAQNAHRLLVPARPEQRLHERRYRRRQVEIKTILQFVLIVLVWDKDQWRNSRNEPNRGLP